MIDFLIRYFDGSKVTGHRPNRKPYHKWALAGQMAEDFLVLICPFLVIKKEQADIAFRFRETFKKTGWRVSDEQVRLRTQYHRDMAALKNAAYNRPHKFVRWEVVI